MERFKEKRNLVDMKEWVERFKQKRGREDRRMLYEGEIGWMDRWMNG